MSHGTPGGAWGAAQVVQLGAVGHAISSDVAVLDGGAVLVGADADELRATNPARLVPRVIDRVGDPITIFSGGEELFGQDLVAQLVVWVAQQVADIEQADAQKIMVTVPAAWGTHRRELLLDALSDAGLLNTGLISEPEAAATRYVDRNGWSDTAIVAVVGIGASALRTAVVRGDGRDQQVLGVPDGSDSVGGRIFDDAMTRHVATALGVTLPTLGGASRDEGDLVSAPVISDEAAAELRTLCIEAKELLSIDTHVTIEPTVLGASRVRMVRAELESLIRKPVASSVDALRRTVRSAGLTADDITAVIFVGGSVQVPLIAEIFSTEFGRPVEVDPDPSFAVALGAARLAADAAGTPIEDDEDEEDDEPVRGFKLHWRRPRKPAMLVAAACVLALISAGGLVAATAKDNAGQSEQRPSRAVNLTTLPGTDGEPTDGATLITTTEAVGPEGARAEGSSSAADIADIKPGTTTAPKLSSAPAIRTAAAAPPADASTPAVITPVTLAGTSQAPATTAASVPATLPETSASASASESTTTTPTSTAPSTAPTAAPTTAPTTVTPPEVTPSPTDSTP